MKAREQLERSIEEEIAFYMKKTQEWHAKRDSVYTYKFAEAIDRILVLCKEPEHINISTMSLTITFKNNNDSRHFVEKMMDKFGINKINKTFTSWSLSVNWYYETYVNFVDRGYDVHVYPCEPAPDCNPIKVQYEIKKEKWVCESTGKEL